MMKKLSFLGVFVLLLLAAGCVDKEASHLPPIWQWPTAAIGTAIDNGMYDSRRKKVKSYLSKHYESLQVSILNDALWASLSPEFLKACDIARVNSDSCTELHRQLKQDSYLYFPKHKHGLSADESEELLENLTVAFMAHSN